MKLEQYKAYFQDNFTTLYDHDCRSMYELPDNSIQCVVTSPPYWGLRKYAGNQDLIWGGKDCQHEWGKEIPSGGYRSSDSNPGVLQSSATCERTGMLSQFCSLCSAWRGALGLEPTPELYVQHIVEVCREIKRVLRPDGVFWLNCGDSYAGSGSPGGDYRDGKSGDDYLRPYNHKGNGLKPKDLCLIPERFALAVQQDGWYIRARIAWVKPNPMPESVRDRPTDSWEHIWMLTKSARYYYDCEAVKEPVAESTIGRGPVDFGGAKGRAAEFSPDDPNFRNGSEQWGRTFDYRESCANGRNLRSAWTFPTQSYKGAHFATFPEELPERCIKATTSEKGCCPKCGKPWVRIIEKPEAPHDGHTEAKERDNPQANTMRISLLRQAARERGGEYVNETKTLGWQPGCECGLEPIPCTVLDLFAGSGTTLWVAKKLGRRSVGYELSTEYCELAMNRNRQEVLL